MSSHKRYANTLALFLLINILMIIIREINDNLPIAFLYASIAAEVFASSIYSCPISVQINRYLGFRVRARWKYRTAFLCCPIKL